MLPAVAGALIAGGADLLGGLFSNASARASAKKQRDWEERMSNTSYQRQRADLEKAGFNPMLGYMKGSGASTPSSSAAPVADFSKIGTSAMSNAMSAASRAQIPLQSAAIVAQTQNSAASARLSNATAANLEEEAAARRGVPGGRAAFAGVEFETKLAEARKAGVDFETALIGKHSAQRAFDELQPLQIAATRYGAESARLSLPEAAATAKFWESMGGVGKGGTAAKELLNLFLQAFRTFKGN